MSAKTSNQVRFDKLRERITDLGLVLWTSSEVNVNVYDKGQHLEVSSEGYVKYEARGLTSAAELLSKMEVCLEGMINNAKSRMTELSEAIQWAEEDK
jgi:hypothetical protein